MSIGEARRAIIIAAGRGSRLEAHTEERPKCMVEVAGRSILSHQLEALRQNGVDDLHVVRGYLADQLVVPGGASYHLNEDWAQNNILVSLFCAREAVRGPLLTTYSDIVYTPQVVAALKRSEDDISLVVDRRWAQAYEGRHDHPVEQAELVEMEGDRVVAVGKRVGPERAVGEFIGLAGYSARGADVLRRVYDEVRAEHGDEEPFGAAQRFRKAYLTDLFEELIGRGHRIGATLIDGGWREIDTVEDLERVNEDWGG